MPRNFLFFIQFLLVALSILFLSHYFVYFSIVHFFSLTSGVRKALTVVLFFLPASFVASMILGQRFEGAFPTALYFCSSLWLGVGLTLMTFFAIAWAARGVTLLVTHSPSPALFGGAAIVLTCLTSGYGIWNAYHPRTEQVNVKLRNLAPEWRGKKAVQLSDLHLGRVFGPAFLDNLVMRTSDEKPT